MTAWVIRAGKYGEREAWAEEHSVSGGGFHEVPDLTSVRERDELDRIVREYISPAKEGAIPGYVGQLWALRSRIEPGDLMALPLKQSREVLLGRVTSGYRYVADEPDAHRRHLVGVDWQRRVPKSAIKQDLLYTLGSSLSIFAPHRRSAADRLEALLATGVDPGAVAAISRFPDVVEDEDLDIVAVDRDVAEDALDQIATRIGEEFAGHDLAHLVAALLAADGFVTEEAPPGIDGGIDVLAGRGALGFESPRVLVQVKTGQVGGPVISQLNGLVSTHGADFGLIATWDGLSNQARESIRHHRFRIKVWESSDIVRGYLSHYERLPADITARVPLRRVWVLGPDGRSDG